MKSVTFWHRKSVTEGAHTRKRAGITSNGSPVKGFPCLQQYPDGFHASGFPQSQQPPEKLISSEKSLNQSGKFQIRDRGPDDSRS